MSVPDLSGVTTGSASTYPPSAVRRLFSTFAHGAPGAGLLLLRLASGTDLLFHAVLGLMRVDGAAAEWVNALCACLGLMLLPGLWTPIAGGLLAIEALSYGFAHSRYAWHSLLLGAIGAALALLGPGGWSIDAQLFGWKRMKIPANGSEDPPAPF